MQNKKTKADDEVGKTSVASLGAISEPVLVRDQTFQRLRDAIINGQLKPGTFLVERELCEAMGVSRSSIREVLRRLDAEKLVANRPRGRVMVARITRSQAEEIYSLRAAIEGMLVVKFIAHATKEDMTRLEAISDEFAAFANAGDVASAVAAMADFYTLISTVSRADVLKDVFDQLMARTSFLRATSMSTEGRITDSIKEIRAIVTAVQSRDPEAARESVVTHVQSAAKTALARLED